MISVTFVRETIQFAKADGSDDDDDANLPFRTGLKRATYGDRTLFAAAQAGHIENFVDTLFWTAVPLYLTNRGPGIAAAGFVVSVHSWVYFLQIVTGDTLIASIGVRP